MKNYYDGLIEKLETRKMNLLDIVYYLDGLGYDSLADDVFDIFLDADKELRELEDEKRREERSQKLLGF